MKQHAPLRLALIGAGGISAAHVRACLVRPDRLRLALVCDTRADAARALAEAHGAEWVTDLRDACRPERVDAALITLPHFLHYPVARQCLEAGLPVLVEKPVTCTGAELRDLDRLAARSGLVLMAGQMRRFGAATREVKAWQDADATRFGALRSFDLVVQVNIAAYTGQITDHWILDGAKAGGGVVASFGVHRLDLVRHLGGADFAEVTALGRFDRPFTNGAESQASVLFRMSNGAVGTLHANALASRTPYMDSFCLHGSHGSVVEAGGGLRYATATGVVTKAWGDQHEGFVTARDPDDPSEDPFVRQLLAFADAVAGVAPLPFNSARDNFNTIACLDAIAASLRSGRTEPVAAWESTV